MQRLYFRNKYSYILFFLLAFFSMDMNAQLGFEFENPKKRRQLVSFKLINNLIVLPLEINGKKLSFILDSGVSKTILFNISQNDSIGLRETKKIELNGLGKGEAVDAIISRNNTISVSRITGNNETIYVILKDNFDLSAKMGITIHGIIGYNILRNFIVKVNYKTKKLIFYNRNFYKAKKCKKCEVFPLNFYRKKPYIDAQVQLDTTGNTLTNVKLLIDSGGSDAIWLFENTKTVIQTPNKYFNDVLGEGLSGLIFGNRSRIPKIKLGSYEINAPTVSFLDSLSTQNARRYKERNGSIGAGILNKFIVWFDYPNRKITFKKNGSFTKGFDYNMSGLNVIYNGKQLIKEEDLKTYAEGNNNSVSTNNSVNFITSFSYNFKPAYKIRNVVKGSPAFKAGLEKDDVILRINNQNVYELKLEDINRKFQEKDGKRIRMTIERYGVIMKFQFYLKKRI